ncbi:MAG TPA: glycosyltransferase [Puia sp.]|nr:glycosyltransferase [Puia sp.]
MKILMVTDSLFRGGKERRMLELIRGLKDQPEPVDIYLISLTGTVEYDMVYKLPITFEIIERKSNKDLSVVFKLKKIIASYKPDIIHSWSTMASIYLSVSNLFTGIPFINGVLADASDHLNLLDKHYLRVKLTTPFSDVFVSNSEAGIRAYRTPVGRSICIYNGVDFNRFENLRPAPEMEQEMLGGPKGDRIVMGMVAGFDDRKDYGTLIGAAIKMCMARKDLVFLLIGSGPLLEILKSRVPEQFLNTRIIFAGKRSDIESILQVIDIGLLITYYEGISNAIIEYMAMGKPVIATRGGGTEELVKDGLNGYLVAQSSEAQVMGKLDLLLNDKENRMRMGIHARNWVREKFEIKNKTVEYMELYKSLITGNGKRTVST